jgi:hypothetical protein
MKTHTRRIGSLLFAAVATTVAAQSSGAAPAIVTQVFRACCLQDRSCTVTTAAYCTTVGGTVKTSTTCSPTLCQPAVVTSVLAACCFSDQSCQLIPAANCRAAGGTAQSARTCAPGSCTLTIVDLGGARVAGMSGDGRTVVGMSDASIDAPYQPRGQVWREVDRWYPRDIPGIQREPTGVTADGGWVFGRMPGSNGTADTFIWAPGQAAVRAMPRSIGVTHVSHPVASRTGSLILGTQSYTNGQFSYGTWAGPSFAPRPFKLALSTYYRPAAINADGQYLLGDDLSTTVGYAGFSSRLGLLRGTQPGQYSGGYARVMSLDGRYIHGFQPVGTASSQLLTWTTASTPSRAYSTGNLYVQSVVGCTADGQSMIGEALNGTIRLSFVGGSRIESLNNALATQFPSLNLQGWKLQHVKAISADGRTLAGFDGGRPGEPLRGWVIKLPSPLR